MHRGDTHGGAGTGRLLAGSDSGDNDRVAFERREGVVEDTGGRIGEAGGGIGGAAVGGQCSGGAPVVVCTP